MYPTEATTPIAKTIDPRIAMAPSRFSNHWDVWRSDNAAVPNSSTASVLGATPDQSATLRLAAIRVSTLGPAPTTLSATSEITIDSVTMVNSDVIRGNHIPIPINARPHAANPDRKSTR